MIRRTVIALMATGVIALPVVILAQPTGQFARVGYLSAGSRSDADPNLSAFLDGLKQAGWIDGRDFRLEARYADDRIESLPALANQLVALGVDVIFAPTTPAALAAKKATQTIPIVFAIAADPLGNRLVTSLARPEGNVTGLSSQQVELAPKLGVSISTWQGFFYVAFVIDAVAATLNGRPRKTLGWKTPAEALDHLLSNAQATGVATTP